MSLSKFGIPRKFKFKADVKRSKVTVFALIVAKDGTGDYDNIQEAIDSLPASGGAIYIKDGTYEEDSEITIDSDNVKLFGGGRKTIVEKPSGGKMFNITGSYCLIDGIYVKRTSILNPPSAGDIAFQLTGTNNIIKNCSVQNTYNAIVVTGNFNIVENNFIWAVYGNAIDFDSNTDNSIVVNNIVKDCLSGAAIYTQANGNTVMGNYIQGCDIGYRAGSGSDVNAIIGNVMRSNTSGAIQIGSSGATGDSASHNTVTGNVANSNGIGITIRKSGSTNNVVSGNVIRGNTINWFDEGTGTISGANAVSS